MKSHSSLLCGAVASASNKHKLPAKDRSVGSQVELKTLLAGLEEEFGCLTLYVKNTLYIFVIIIYAK